MVLSKGHLDVGDGHQIYYETFGNPKGVNVLFIHGGPGLGFSENDQRFFDPVKPSYFLRSYIFYLIFKLCFKSLYLFN